MNFTPITIHTLIPVEDETPPEEAPRPLRDSARDAIGRFLEALDDQPCSDLYDMVLAQVEEPLLNEVMRHTRGNQSRAADMLGLNRGTLRKKLRRYGLLDQPDIDPSHRN